MTSDMPGEESSGEGPNRTTSDIKDHAVCCGARWGEGDPRDEALFPRFGYCQAPGAVCPGDLLCLAHCPCFAHICLPQHQHDLTLMMLL